MRIIKREVLTKSVLYMGDRFDIPEDHSYMAIDMNGLVASFKRHPYIEGSEHWHGNFEEGVLIATVSDFGNWKESLREV